MSRRHFPLWTLLGVALVVALVVGSGVLSSSTPTAAARAYAIESVLRCPSCEDLSVADSTAQTAVAVRATVRQLLAEGRTDQQIESYLEARYGSTIVLDPPAHGWPLLVWLLPLLGGGVAAVVLGAFLFRRRSGTTPDADRGRAAIPAGPAQLEDRRDFLRRSLADADAEYLAGDLSDRDYLSLRQRDLRRLATVEAELGPKAVAVAAGPAAGTSVAAPASGARAGGARSSAVDRSQTMSGDPDPGVGDLDPGDPDPEPGPDPVPPADAADRATGRVARSRRSWRSRRSRRSRWLLRGATVSFAAALIVAVSLFASNRLPGQTATGSVSATGSQRIAQTLDAAANLENQGQLGQAAQLYQSVLASHPDNEVALAQLGWLEYQTGRSGNSASLTADAEAKLERAARLDPADYAASLYLGTILLQRDGKPAGAVGQYQRFLADVQPAALVRQAVPELRQAYQQAGVALPPQLTGG
ncbi:MAG: cytochrome c-type biogenesis protein CcmH [Acidimicrobiales bacterium]